jgi:predicted permease
MRRAEVVVEGAQIAHPTDAIFQIFLPCRVEIKFASHSSSRQGADFVIGLLYFILLFFSFFFFFHFGLRTTNALHHTNMS